MATPNLPDRSFPLVPHDIAPVILRCKHCRRTINAGFPFIPLFGEVDGQQQMTGCVCVYCEGKAEG
jgi:hypothetical protein